MKTLNMTLSAITAVALLTGCGGGGGSSSSNSSDVVEERIVEAAPQGEIVEAVLQHGRFIDASVKGLGYACQTSARTGVTDLNGIFTCNEGEAIAFYIADNHIGTVLTQEIVTPYTLFPNNQEAAINLAQLLQTLDRDGNPDNGIDLDFDKLALLQGANLDFTDSDFDDDVANILGESLINGEAARQHLNDTLGLTGFEENPAEVIPEVEEPLPGEDDASGSEELLPGEDTPSDGEVGPDLIEEGDDAPIGEGVIEEDEAVLPGADEEDGSSSGGSSGVGYGPDDFVPDFTRPEDIGDLSDLLAPDEEEDSGSSSSRPAWEIPSWQDEIADSLDSPVVEGLGDIDWGAIGDSSSSDGSGSSSSAANSWMDNLNDFNQGVVGSVIDSGINIPAYVMLHPDNFTVSYSTETVGEDKAFYDAACQADFGADARAADWNHIVSLQNMGADMERLMSNLALTMDGESAIIAVDDVVTESHTLWGSQQLKETSLIEYDASYSGTMAIDNGILNGSVLASGQNLPVACYNPVP
jgi:hypothetical protein